MVSTSESGIRFYDARKNTYFVATPDQIRAYAPIPDTVLEAASSCHIWVRDAINGICTHPGAKGDLRHKKYLSDGLLVGPFSAASGFDLLIVNTDGTLAERSGNGLTIFSQFLKDAKIVDGLSPFLVGVHHNNEGVDNPVCAWIEAGTFNDREGFWVDMGLPSFGPEAVGASADSIGVSLLDGYETNLIHGLRDIDENWTNSIFVNVGNPHCVTFLKSEQALPPMERLAADEWRRKLAMIANDSEKGENPGKGRPCRKGMNLQWACVVGPDTVKARVFERGEGPTESSGSSATAVASAARYLGAVSGEIIYVDMPGGTAPIRFDVHEGQLERVMLFGVAIETQIAEHNA